MVTRERGKMDGDTVDTGLVTRLLGSDHENFSFFCFDSDRIEIRFNRIEVTSNLPPTHCSIYEKT